MERALLGSVGPWRLSAGIAVAAATIAFLGLQMRKLQKALARPKAVARLREQLQFANSLAPETNNERRGFWLLSITAGVCEEFLFRGFLMWLIAASTNLLAAVIISSILFGCVHVYLGAAHVPKAAMVGLLLALFVVASGSLWPAIVIHTALDLNGGEISFRVTQAAAAIPETAAPVAS
ncbi:MAG TPA: CPBP family intramembrane glutamic endopeptidase [Candidatus Acidoferrales bacterium]|nr:CPBP family intramembrane glutamic endopeptidase [Candidatus Acidoferrales bacterium]